MTSYELGRLLSPVLMFLGGLALVLSGRRRRRAAEATGATGRGPRTRVALGILLLFLSTVGTAAARLGEEAAVSRTTVALPPSLLGLDRDDSLLGRLRDTALSGFPGGLERTDVGAYGDGSASLIVAAGRGRFENPEGELAHAFPASSLPDAATVDDGHAVPAGELGGSGRCWSAESFGSGADVCGFVSSTSIVLVIDRAAPDAAGAARRALVVRQAVVSVQGRAAAPVDLPSPLSSSTRVSLPAMVGGWKKQQLAELTGPRAEFLASAKRAGLRSADMAAYVADGHVVIAQTALGRFRNKDLVTRVFAQDLAKQTDGPVGAAVPVAGSEGTTMRCWAVRIDGPAVSCLSFDDEYYVVVFCVDSASVPRTAAITRAFASAVVRRG